ncbi:unnamed protein product [Angiostrongylus costaricensis]|uniref:Transposase n=1 Tax=Angiostrongylus costaricensis TaxID=334426 RepID=A0A0R3PSQ2_ANGCS|nr:unnamed protein product [Angiostrongylus costaricensis]
MGSKLYIKQDLMMCETDYRRLYGYRGMCTSCRQVIPPCDLVMRASFVVGERFRLHDNQILCESDWRELRLFSQAAYNDRSLNLIARNLREMPDFQPVSTLKNKGIGFMNSMKTFKKKVDLTSFGKQ